MTLPLACDSTWQCWYSHVDNTICRNWPIRPHNMTKTRTGHQRGEQKNETEEMTNPMECHGQMPEQNNWMWHDDRYPPTSGVLNRKYSMIDNSWYYYPCNMTMTWWHNTWKTCWLWQQVANIKEYKWRRQNWSNKETKWMKICDNSHYPICFLSGVPITYEQT